MPPFAQQRDRLYVRRPGHLHLHRAAPRRPNHLVIRLQRRDDRRADGATRSDDYHLQRDLLEPSRAGRHDLQPTHGHDDSPGERCAGLRARRQCGRTATAALTVRLGPVDYLSNRSGHRQMHPPLMATLPRTQRRLLGSERTPLRQARLEVGHGLCAESLPAAHPSWSSSHRLIGNPQRKPPSAPPMRRIRWHGTKSAAALRAHALAAARVASGRPERAANSV